MGNSSPVAVSTNDQANAPVGSTPTVTVQTLDHGTGSMTLDDEEDGSGGGTATEEASSLETGKDGQDSAQVEAELRPPLPPRPSLLKPANRPGSAYASKPTTGLSSIDIQTLSFPDGSRGTFSTPASRAVSESVSISGNPGGQRTLSRKISRNGSEFDDSASVMSYAPTLKANGDLASLLDEGLSSQSAAWKLLSTQTGSVNALEEADYEDRSLVNFEQEFDEIEAVDNSGANGEEVLLQWKSKFKHYLILSSAGKPIYSRHGDQNLINGYIGIIQTIISFFQGAKDPLMGFTAGATRFVVSIAGPLYFVAISKLGESDVQLRAQLDALYMQILSTLTLPTLTQLFTSRPNTDLRRPLEGTEILLSSLADTFTKGSPTALLSALECLKIRKSQRLVINNTLLKARSEKLLYGMVVAGGRLVSVIRPKRHSLHPSDLQLIFNMLFEAGSVKAGGGENWIPVCLPGFNNRGYLYMYVSFLSALDEKGTASEERPSITSTSSSSREDEIAVLLISADKESFFELKQMRDDVVAQLYSNGSMEIIRTAVSQGRPSTTDIVPGTSLRHFLYKSRANVQFTMPSFSPHFDTLLARRKLMTLYHNLHASTHAKHSHLKILHCMNRDSISLAWTTPTFELYCVAGPHASRAGLAQGANKVIQWVKREEERVFIIGGAVF
ncbi:Vacuolar fusion protein mon-1 [Drepanopeziza brunnea f. sp. 'multigermtubi' MB_m1]|uniref:Vacuolar fusion protein MON1 n=1 Tax=Marssonina brunnea f. sp. multigermtubi (strain MB_m1) TaxID=1072389 RepID=K1Y266_MARBU|nr:Vacuolar fusion protein mon-1 [Drepanopeziza brunnea f. sp. 'multigermtubi' MB_m1]EKD19224.1 Vacuolar fusion protein mon-1 [Drepanopeziza brunnea f. sp. 'multigermtubi' MB_m1]